MRLVRSSWVVALAAVLLVASGRPLAQSASSDSSLDALKAEAEAHVTEMTTFTQQMVYTINTRGDVFSRKFSSFECEWRVVAVVDWHRGRRSKAVEPKMR